MIEVRNTKLVRDESFDLVIACLGYELRSSYVASLRVPAKAQLAVRLPHVPGASYDSNERMLREIGWELVSPDSLDAALDDRLRQHERGVPTRVGIDISSMPRSILAQVLEFLSQRGGGIRATFLYSPAWFEASVRQARLDTVLTASPVSRYFSGAVRPSHLPIGLVVGLGMEPHRSDGVREFLEPERVWAFVAHGLDDRFVSGAHEVNNYFLWGAGVDPLTYDIRDMAGTFRALNSLCTAAGENYRVVLAPSGPKVFALACLLAGLGRDRRRPAVWRVGAAVGPTEAVDVEPTGEVVACEVRFLGENVEPGVEVRGTLAPSF